MNRFKLYACAFAFFSLLDLTFTGFLLTDPSFFETNPIANWVLQNWGFGGMAFYKTSMVSLAFGIALVIKKESILVATRLMAVASFVVGLVVAYSFVLFLAYAYEVLLVTLGY